MDAARVGARGGWKVRDGGGVNIRGSGYTATRTWVSIRVAPVVPVQKFLA